MAENVFNSDWNVLMDSFNESNIAKVPFMKLQAGKNVVRIVSNPSKIYQHWEKTNDGKMKKITCIGADCPICKIGHTAQVRFQMKVLDKIDATDPQPKILETGATIIRQIGAYIQDEDFGHPSKYDIKIQKEGLGRDTRYTVTASPHKSEITEREKKLIESLPDIQEINKQFTKEQILNMGLTCFDTGDNTDLSDDDDFAPPSQSFKNSSPKKSQALEDWENL
jgi:hypothetical protein